MPLQRQRDRHACLCRYHTRFRHATFCHMRAFHISRKVHARRTLLFPKLGPCSFFFFSLWQICSSSKKNSLTIPIGERHRSYCNDLFINWLQRLCHVLRILAPDCMEDMIADPTVRCSSRNLRTHIPLVRVSWCLSFSCSYFFYCSPPLLKAVEENLGKCIYTTYREDFGQLNGG